MLNQKSSRHRLFASGQALVEFAIALPVLLLLVLGIIEFGRLFQAWLAVQNSARFGLRYAVTGEYNSSYCGAAAGALGLQSADTHNGDPANDCHVPDSYGPNARDLSNLLIDWTRLPSSRDSAWAGAAGILIDNLVIGDYLQFLKSHSIGDLGDPSKPGYLHVTICSNRDRDNNLVNDFWQDSNAFPVTCFDNINGYYMDDGGAPGDRVRVSVTFVHKMLTPIFSSIWPQVNLIAWREGIVEQFRTSRISGLGSSIGSPPTNTPVPSPTFTPSTTPTPTETSLPTTTPAPTTTPDCSLYTLGNFYWVGSGAQLGIDVLNNSPLPVGVPRIVLDWGYAEQLGSMMNYPNLMVDWFQWNGAYAWGNANGDNPPNDYDSPTDTSADFPAYWHGPLTVAPNSAGRLWIDFDNNWSNFETSGLLLLSDFGISVELDNGCPALTRPPVPRPLPQPDCQAYSISNFSMLDSGNIQATVTNGDILNANVTRIRVNWDYLENYFQTVYNDSSMSLDYIQFSRFGGGSAWGAGSSLPVDYDSITDTSLDSPLTWTGPLLFEAGQNHILRMDFDKTNEIPSNWLVANGIMSSDFGIIIDFDNGCQISRGQSPRPIATPTPSCNLLYTNGVQVFPNLFQINVKNDNVVTANLIYSTLTWPTSWDTTGQLYWDYFQFRGNRYYDGPNPYLLSPVAAPAPSIPLAGGTQDWWQAVFANWPSSVAGSGCFSGELTFDLNGLTCVLFGQVCVQPTSTPTVTRTATSTPRPSSTPTITLTATNTRTSTVTATATISPPVSTGTATRTSTATSGPPSSTPVPPTVTHTPTPTVCLTPPDLGGC